MENVEGVGVVGEGEGVGELRWNRSKRNGTLQGHLLTDSKGDVERRLRQEEIAAGKCIEAAAAVGGAFMPKRKGEGRLQRELSESKVNV